MQPASRPIRRAGWTFALALFGILASASELRAAPANKEVTAEVDTAQVKALYAQGTREYNLANYAEALKLFEQFYKLDPLPGMLFNIAQCHRMLGHLEQARAVYQHFLNEDRAAPHPQGDRAETRLQAEAMLHDVEATLAKQAELRGRQPTGLVTADKPTSAPGTLDEAVQEAMTHEAPDGRALATGQAQPPNAPRSKPAPAAAIAAPPPQKSHAARIAGWSLVGASVAAAGVATVFGFGAKSSAADWTAATTQPAWQSAQDDAHSKATDANVAWVAAGVLAAAGVVTLIVAARDN